MTERRSGRNLPLSRVRVAGLGEVLLGAAAETARWRLQTWDDLDLEEAAVLLVAAHPGGAVAFETGAAVSELLEQPLPVVGQTMGDQPLADGLQDVQMARYVGSGRLGLEVHWPGLSLDEVLERCQFAYRGIDGHSQETDYGAEIHLLWALEANIM